MRGADLNFYFYLYVYSCCVYDYNWILSLHDGDYVNKSEFLRVWKYVWFKLMHHTDQSLYRSFLSVYLSLGLL